MFEGTIFLHLSHARVRVGPESRIPNPNAKPAISLSLRRSTNERIKVRNLGPKLSTIFVVWVSVRAMIGYELRLACVQHRPSTRQSVEEKLCPRASTV